MRKKTLTKTQHGQLFTTVFGNLVDVLWRRANQNVLGLNVRVDNVTGLVEVFQPLQYLRKNTSTLLDRNFHFCHHFSLLLYWSCSA